MPSHEPCGMLTMSKTVNGCMNDGLQVDGMARLTSFTSGEKRSIITFVLS